MRGSGEPPSVFDLQTLLFQGEVDKMLELYETRRHQSEFEDLPLLEQYLYVYFYVHGLYVLGRHTKGITVLQTELEKRKQQEFKDLEAVENADNTDSWVWLVYVLQLNRKFEGAVPVKDTAARQSSIIHNKSKLGQLKAATSNEQVYTCWEILILHAIGNGYRIIRQSSEALSTFKAALECSTHSEFGNPGFTIEIYLQLMGISVSLEVFDQAGQYLTTGLHLARQVQYHHYEAVCLAIFGIKSKLNGEYQQALSYYQQSLEIFRGLPAVYLDQKRIEIALADIYISLGEMDNALSVLQQLETESDTTDRPLSFQVSLLNKISKVYKQKNDIKLARSYLLKCWTKFHTLDNEQWHGTIEIEVPFSDLLAQLVLLSLEASNLKEAQAYLNQLEEQHARVQFIYIRQNYQLAKALVLKQQPDIIAKAEAKQLLLKLSRSQKDYAVHPILVNIHLCDIYFDEYKLYQHPQTLEAIQSLVQNMYELGQSQQAFNVVIQALLLQAKVAMLEYNAEKMQRFITQALLIAEEKGLVQLHEQVIQTQQLFITQQATWPQVPTSRITGAQVQTQYEQLRIGGTLQELEFSASTTVKISKIADYLAQIPADILQEIESAKTKINSAGSESEGKS